MMWLRMAGEFMSIYICRYSYLNNVSYLDWIEQARVSVKRGYIWQEKSSISSTVMYLSYILFYWNIWRTITITGVMKSTAFVYWLHSNQYVSNLNILDWNTRLSSYMIGVTYSDYMSLPLVCNDCPLTSKTGGCWNMLESTPDMIPLIRLSHKWTQILFLI